MANYTILIADDEEIERKALSLLLRKEFPEIEIVAVASNGLEMVSLLQQHQPDIAIVDVNMPGINGIDAIDLLRAKGSQTHFIINTAYDEFSYVQRALSLKIDAYILKPEKRDTTIQTIRKLCRQIDATRQNSYSQQQIHALFTQVHSVLESEIMYSLFIGEPAEENFATYCDMHGVHFDSGVVVSLIPDGQDRILSQEKIRLKRAMDAQIGSNCVFLLSITEANICLMMFVDRKPLAEQQHWIHDVLRVTVSRLDQTLGLHFRVGVGSVYSDFGRMADSYRESLLALMMTENSDIAFYTPQNTVYDDEAELLVHLLREKSIERIGMEITRMRATVQNDPGFADGLWTAISALLEHEAAALPACREQLEKTGRELKSHPSDPVRVLQEGLAILCEALHSAQSLSESSYVNQALQYIEEHFSEDISLDVVADKIGISTYYLSRLFKAERGESFVEYLTSVRMKNAVMLARDTRLSIREIALKTGYASPTYFCRVFKKYTGGTIGDLREKMRKKQF